MNNVPDSSKTEAQKVEVINKAEKTPSKIRAGLLSTNKIMVYFAAVALFGMMAVTVVDVVGRYFFNSPLMGAYELVGILLAIAGTWAMAYTQLQKAHVRVDFIFNRLSQRIKKILTSLAHLVGLIGFSVLTWRLAVLAEYFLSLTKGNNTDTMGIPLFPFVVVTAIGTGMLALVLIYDFVNSLIEVDRK